MKICAIVAEFNPFHNGHLYLINKAKELTKADKIIVIMSGNFVQRGEPAIIDKWTRTEMALLNNVDAVFELPVYFSNSSAENFAYGSVTILEKLGVDYICFGSEIADIDLLYEISNILNSENIEYKKILDEELKKGHSFQKAICKIVDKNLNGKNVVLKSNDLLAIAYIRNILKYNYNILPICVKRIENDYNSLDIKNISSATSIRNILQKRSINYELLSKTIPNNIYELYYNYPKFIELDDFHLIFNIIFIREYFDNKLKNIRLLNEGIEHYINNNLTITNDIYHMVESLQTKRYSLNRLRRLLIDIILGIEEIKHEDLTNCIDFVRVLGMKNDENSVIRDLKKKSQLFFLQNYGRDLKKYGKNNKLIDIDIKANKIYSHINFKYDIKTEYEQKPIII